jgi:hypothetical protein
MRSSLVVIDTLIAELIRHMSAYSSIAERFAVFRECLDKEGKGIRVAAQRLVAAYESHLEVDSVYEFIHFHKLLKTELGKPVAEPNQYESGDCRATTAQAHMECMLIFCQFFQTFKSLCASTCV